MIIIIVMILGIIKIIINKNVRPNNEDARIIVFLSKIFFNEINCQHFLRYCI